LQTAVAYSLLTADMPLLCDALLLALPFRIPSTIWRASSVIPLVAGLLSPVYLHRSLYDSPSISLVKSCPFICRQEKTIEVKQ
jgi:hypothetical protein